MNIFKNGVDLLNSLEEFIDNSSRLSIYVPYIKLVALEHLINHSSEVKSITVRWEPKDLITGASDLEIYPYLKERGITLFRNNRLHLKSFVDNNKRCFLGSANISSRALNLPKSSYYNYELATIVDDLSLDDRLYFLNIERESTLITDNIFEQIKEQLVDWQNDVQEEDDFNLKIEAPDKDFLISSLPMSFTVASFLSIYQTGKAVNEEELNCFLHDLALYEIPLGLPIDEVYFQLNNSFLTHPFIKAFLENLDEKGEMYFGSVKSWIHDRCADVPIPRKWEITLNIQILYKWIIALGEGKYGVDQPNYSERLFVCY
jgi:hypothetical protein